MLDTERERKKEIVAFVSACPSPRSSLLFTHTMSAKTKRGANARRRRKYRAEEPLVFALSLPVLRPSELCAIPHYTILASFQRVSSHSERIKEEGEERKKVQHISSFEDSRQTIKGRRQKQGEGVMQFPLSTLHDSAFSAEKQNNIPPAGAAG